MYGPLGCVGYIAVYKGSPFKSPYSLNYPQINSERQSLAEGVLFATGPSMFSGSLIPSPRNGPYSKPYGVSG